MAQRQLGQSGISVAPLALGGNVFGWTIDERKSFAVLDAFVDHGLQLIDTANMYSAWVPGNQGGESEIIIGKWFASSGRRDQVVLATKVGMPMGDGSTGLKKDYILKSVEDSLKRLQTDRIDLYQSHQPDESTPIEETLAAYDQLIKAGKVRAIGASNYSAPQLAHSLEVSRQHNLPCYVTLQPEYNLYDRAGFEEELQALCVREKIGVIGYYSLASGFLTGKYRSAADLKQSARGDGVGKKYLNPRGERILEAVDQVAAEHAVTPAVIALAWLIHQPAVTAPIASATSPEQLHEIAQSVSVTLSAAQLEKLNLASNP